MSRDRRLYRFDIVEYAGHIGDFTRTMSFDEFTGDLKTQIAVLRCLEIIGEAIKNLSADELALHAEIPWRRIARFRDRLAHAYFGIDLDIVWDVVQNKLPEVISAVHQMIASDLGNVAGGETL
ncbi:MAG: hypothetical protein JWM27_2092 [Gemmatimonadetes bacterium]|nr:hypothetical protein [Gemmatimonadota bacterium]